MHPELARVLEGFEIAVAKDQEILGCLYTGSLGRQETDLFSDLDIELWVSEAVRTKIEAKLSELLQYLGSIQFVYYTGPAATGFVTSHWYRVDIDLKWSEDLQPKSRYAQAMVKKDRNGFLGQVVEASQLETLVVLPEQAQHEIAEIIDSQIYLALHAARGDLWTAAGEIISCCGTLYRLLGRLRGRETYGFLYVSQLLSQAEQTLMAEVWPAGLERDEIRRAGRALWAWTAYVWEQLESTLETPLGITLDPESFLQAVDDIYSWTEV